MPLRPASRKPLAARSIPMVMSVSAGPPLGGLYLKPPSSGGLCDGRDHDAVGQAALAALVVAQDGVRDHRRRRIAVVLVDHHLDAVGGEHLERARQRRLGQRMGVDADEQRPVDAGLVPMVADRLADRQDMRLVEGVIERRAAMPGSAERHPLRRHRRIGPAGEIGRHQLRDVRQHRLRGGLACRRIDLSGHGISSMPFMLAIDSAAKPDPPRHCRSVLPVRTTASSSAIGSRE